TNKVKSGATFVAHKAQPVTSKVKKGVGFIGSHAKSAFNGIKGKFFKGQKHPEEGVVIAGITADSQSNAVLNNEEQIDQSPINNPLGKIDMKEEDKEEKEEDKEEKEEQKEDPKENPMPVQQPVEDLITFQNPQQQNPPVEGMLNNDLLDLGNNQPSAQNNDLLDLGNNNQPSAQNYDLLNL
ncbi:MAG: hypothetical protein MJ252_15845, partial [archaeon]|nr:hypothetical protein [archaeon]